MNACWSAEENKICKLITHGYNISRISLNQSMHEYKYTEVLTSFRTSVSVWMSFWHSTHADFLLIWKSWIWLGWTVPSKCHTLSLALSFVKHLVLRYTLYSPIVTTPLLSPHYHSMRIKHEPNMHYTHWLYKKRTYNLQKHFGFDVILS